MNLSKFTHLHLHTKYSMLDGVIFIDKLIPRIKELGMDSVAITDHSNIYGAADFYKQCNEAGIKPIIGCEFYVSPDSRHRRDYIRGETSSYHLILLAENNTGFENLRKLLSIANNEGFYYRPRIDKETLEQHNEGLIALSACLGGEIAQKLLESDYNGARDVAFEYERIMGKNNYFLELVNNNLPEQNAINTQIIKLSEETGIPLVATCDCHYLNKEDGDSRDIIVHIQMGAERNIHSQERIDELWLKSAKEMADAFSETTEAILNTQRIAERCNVIIEPDVLAEYINVNFHKFIGRELVREICQVMVVPADEANQLIEAIPDTAGATVGETIQQTPAVESFYQSTPNGGEVLKHALKLEPSLYSIKE